MFGINPYHAAIKKHISILATLFNDISIVREGLTGDTIQTMLVPISYGPKEKFLARVTDDPNLDKPTSIQLPRISFELTGMEYDSNRVLNGANKFTDKCLKANKTSYTSVNMPVPYDFNFTLTVLSKSAEDGAHIAEQILPFFRPAWAVRAQLLEEFPDYILDIYTILNSVVPQDLYDGEFKQRQIVTWTFEFTMQGWIFGPVETAKIIKIADVPIVTDWNTMAVAENIRVQPGLTANGTPTYSLTDTISPLLIEDTDNYGIITTITNP